MKEKCDCRIQSTDGIIYELLKSGQCGFLMVKEDEGGSEYIIALEPKRQGEEYHWEQARYFKLPNDARKAFASLEEHFIKEGKAVFKYQSISIMKEVAKKLACGITAIEIYRQYGREALLNTMAGIAICRPRMAKEVKEWAVGRAIEPFSVGDMPTNDQIFKAWRDACDMRLF